MVAAATVLFLALSGVAPLLLSIETSFADRAQCSDGVDNDGNGFVDFPQDPACSSLDDPLESLTQNPVFMTLTDGKDEIRAGDSLIYVITMVQQREDLRDVSVDFTVPAEIDLLSADRGGDIQGYTIHWSHLALQNNVILRLTVQARVKATAPIGRLIVARATLADGTVALDSTRVTSSDISPIVQPFRASITDGHDFIQSQADLVYTLTGQNISNTDRTTKVQVFIPDNVILTGIPPLATYDGHTLTWDNVPFHPGETHVFTFSVHIPSRLRNYRPIYMRALVGSALATDNTVILNGFPGNVLGVSISADRPEAAPGDLITYTVGLQNPTNAVATAAQADASLPLYGQFVSVTEGGFWDGRAVHWRNLQIAPGGTRSLQYTVRVREDAPAGGRLIAEATADGAKDSVVTNIVGVGQGQRFVPPPVSVPYAPPSHVLLRKTSDRSEAIPGGRIRYTVMVQNVLLHPINEAVVSDSFDPTYLSIVDRGDAVVAHSGEMRWIVPSLAPGQVWQTSYVLAVSKDAPQGISINNIARISGSDVADASFSERVTVTQTGILRELPSTGAAMDAFVALLLLPLASMPAMIQRRRMA